MPRTQKKNATTSPPDAKAPPAGKPGKDSLVLGGTSVPPPDRGEEIFGTILARGGENIFGKIPPRAEFDFSACPDQELWECWLWETCRHREKVCRFASYIRGLCESPTLAGLYTALNRRFSNPFDWPHHWLFFANEFPSTPFLSIPPESRKRYRVTFNGGLNDLTARAAMLDTRLTMDGTLNELLQTGRTSGRSVARRGSSEIVVLEIPWYFSNQSLMKSLKTWLERRRPADIPISERRGHGSQFERMKVELKRLAAWRLTEFYGLSIAKLESNLPKFGVKLYTSDESWSRARTKVRESFEAIVRDHKG